MKHKSEVGLALLGFLLGASVLAGGETDDGLVESLRALQRSAEQVIQDQPAGVDWTPTAGAGMELRFFPVADLTAPRWDYVPVPLSMGVDEDSEIPLFGAIAEEAPQPLGTIEELMELVRSSVRPESWDDGPSLQATGSTLVVFHAPEVLDEIGTYLDGLREQTERCATVEARILEVDGAAVIEMKGTTGHALDDAQVGTVTRWVREGRAREVFHASVLGLLGERVDLWRGAEHALFSDADVEVAQTASTTDPVVEGLNTGGRLSVRSSAVGDTGRLLLDIDLAHVELGHPLRTQETGRNGVLDAPAWRRGGGATTLVVDPGRWTVAAAGSADEGAVRVLLVRGSVVEAKGGAR